MKPISLAPCLVLIGIACRSPATPPSPSSPTATAPASHDDAESDAPPSAPGDLPWPTAEACRAAAVTDPPKPTVADDLRDVVGGHFSIDHLGPDRIEATEDHIQREPDAFLDAWAHEALAPDAFLDRSWSVLLSHTGAARPERTRLLAGCLMTRIDAALAAPPAGADTYWSDRMTDRHRALYLVWRSPLQDGTWRLAVPEGGSIETTDGEPTLRVDVPCHCGEPIGCTIAAGPNTLDALVTLDLTAPARCRDCFAGSATCALPPGTAGASITLNGRSMPTRR